MIVARDNWDAVVIGAGPAGGVAALRLAQGGARVLLVDRAVFPREKVCGCCVNHAAATMLDLLGLHEAIAEAGARPIERFRLHTKGRASTLSLPGFSLSRAALDAIIVAAAVRAGAVFVDGVSTQLHPQATACETTGRVARASSGSERSSSGESTLRVHHGQTTQSRGLPVPHDRTARAAEHRTIILRRGEKAQTITARIVLACTGLASRLLEHEPGMTVRIARTSLMGCAAIAPAASDFSFVEPGVIHMAHGRGGYVGLVRLEDDRVDIAAALKPAFVRAWGGPARAVTALFADAGLPPLNGAHLDWHGTPLLTRSLTPVAAHRLFVLGDAAAYVEPFTGEGIAWAIASALAVAPLALRAIEQWDGALAAHWMRDHRALLGDRQRRCRWLTRSLRPALVTGWVNGVVARLPSLAGPFVRAINRPWPGMAAWCGTSPQARIEGAAR